MATFNAIEGSLVSAEQLGALNAGCAGMRGEFLGSVGGEALGNVTTSCAATLTPTATAALTSEQASALTDAVIGALTPAATATLAPGVVGALTAEQFDSFAYASTFAMTAAQLGALSASVCAHVSTGRTTFFAGTACVGLTPACVLALPSLAGLTGDCVAAQQALIASNASAAALESLSAAGWQGVTSQGAWSTLLGARQAVVLNVSAAALAQVSTADIAVATALVDAQQLDHTVLTNGTDVGAASWLVVTLWQNESLANLTATQLGDIPTFSLAGVRAGQIINCSFDVMSHLTASQCDALSSSAVGGIGNEQIYYVTPSAFVGFCDNINAFNDDAANNITVAQLEALGNSSCTGDDVSRQSVTI